MQQQGDANQKGQAFSTDSETIWTMRKQVEDAFNRGDAQALVAAFTDDAVFILFDGSSFEGKEAIEQMHAGLFKEFPNIRMDFTRTSLRFPSLNVAIEDVTYIEQRVGTPPIHGGDTTVFVKRDGGWRVDYVRLYTPTIEHKQAEQE